ncbi:MAG: VanZ family protein [Candidatus Berkiella sp.]
MRKDPNKHALNTPFTDSQIKTSLVVLFVLFTAFIFYGALFPFHDWRVPERPTLTILFYDWLNHIFLFDIVQNLMLFFPFGLLLGSYLLHNKASKKTTLLIPLLASFSVSLTVELLQTFNPVRIPSLLDITLNVISGFWGASFAHRFMRYYPQGLQQIANNIDMGSKQNLWPFLGMLTWLGFACYQILPCIPTLHPMQLWEGVQPVFQFFKGDVPFYLDRFFLYVLQGTMMFFSAKLFLKPKHSFAVLTGFISIMLMIKITIIGRYLTIEMLTGCYGAVLSLSMAQKMMEILLFENKKEIEVELSQ